LFAGLAFALLLVSMVAVAVALAVGYSATSAKEKPLPESPKAEVVTGARFVSALDGTKKITVTCGDRRADGPQSVSIALPNPVDCSVEVVDANRTRWRAKVQNVQFREYNCFENGEKSCK